MIPEHWLENGDPASETPRCDVRILDAGPEALEAAAMFVMMIPADVLSMIDECVDP